MYLHDGYETGVQVVRLRLLGVEHLDGKRPARYREDGRLEEVLRELDGVQGGRGDDQLELRPLGHRLLEQAEEDVGVDGALVRLVQHDDAVVFQVQVHEALSQ